MFHNYETIVTQLRDARLTSMKRAKLPSNCKAISIECPSKSTPILPFRTTISRLPLDNSAFTAHRARLTDQEIRLTGNWHSLLSGPFNYLFRTLLFLLLFFWSSRFAGTFFGLFLRLFFCYLCRSFLYGNATVGIIRQYTCHNLLNHLFQFFQKLPGIISSFFNLTKFLLPYTGQFGRFQEFLMDKLYQFHTRRGSYQILFLLTDIVSLEQGLDNGSAR